MFNSLKSLFAGKITNYDDFFSNKNNKFVLIEKVNYDEIINFNSKDLKEECLDPQNDLILSFSIFSNVYKIQDRFLFGSLDFDCSLFFLKPGFLGREFNKTCSFSNFKKEISKEVLFEVICGSGYILIQNLENVESEIKVIKVKKNDFILIDKNVSFTIINSSNDNLILFSLREKGCIFNDNILNSFSGNIFYYTKRGFIKNNNILGDYILHDFEGDYIKDLSFDKNMGLYKELVKLPEKFNFLKE